MTLALQPENGKETVMRIATGNKARNLATLMFALAGVLVLGVGPALAAPIPPPLPDSGWLLDEGTGLTTSEWNAPGTGQLGGHTGVAPPSWSTDTPFAYSGNHSLEFVSTGIGQNANWCELDGQWSGTQGTVSFWVKDTNGTSPSYITDSSNGSRTLLYRAGANFQLYINQNHIGNPGGGLVPGPPSSDWTHVAIVWDNSLATDRQKVYQNGGAPYATFNDTVGTVNPALTYLGSRMSRTEGWGGNIDEFAVWNRPLSQDEVDWLAANSLSNIPNTQPSNPDKAWLFNEGSGTTAHPFFGPDDGTLHGGVGWSSNNPGRHASGTSLDFDGTDGSRVNFPSHTFGAAGTIALWAYKDTADTAARYLFDASAGARSLLYRAGSNWNLHLNDQFIASMDASLIPDFEWTHLVFTWDNALPYERIKVFQNGDLFATFNNTLTPNVASMLWLGSRHSNDEAWLGYLDDFGLWDRALAPGEVDWLYEESIGTLPEPGTLSLLALGGAAAWWRRRRR
jgi:hypothetical protein